MFWLCESLRARAFVCVCVRERIFRPSRLALNSGFRITTACGMEKDSYGEREGKAEPKGYGQSPLAIGGGERALQQSSPFVCNGIWVLPLLLVAVATASEPLCARSGVHQQVDAQRKPSKQLFSTQRYKGTHTRNICPSDRLPRRDTSAKAKSHTYIRTT